MFWKFCIQLSTKHSVLFFWSLENSAKLHFFQDNIFNAEKVQCVSPAVEEGEDPVVVLKEGEDVDGDGGEDEHQVEHCKSHNQPIECVLPQLKRE